MHPFLMSRCWQKQFLLERCVPGYFFFKKKKKLLFFSVPCVSLPFDFTSLRTSPLSSPLEGALECMASVTCLLHCISMSLAFFRLVSSQLVRTTRATGIYLVLRRRRHPVPSYPRPANGQERKEHLLQHISQ